MSTQENILKGKVAKGWEKINLYNVGEYKSFFHEKYGLLTGIVVAITAIDENNKSPSRSDLYWNRDPEGNINNSILYQVGSMTTETILNSDFFVLKDSSNGVNPQTISVDKAQKLNLKFDTIIHYRYRFIYGDRDLGYMSSPNEIQEKFVFSNNKEFEQLTVWANKAEIKSYYKPAFMDLEKGQKYFYCNKGVCEVIEVFDYPVKNDNIVCRVKFEDGKTLDIKWGDDQFAYLPFQYEDELGQFNVSLNEIKLQPYVDFGRYSQHGIGVYNVMWQPIEEAARYIVKIYKYRDIDNKRKVYFLKDYVVERNTHVVSFGDLVGALIIVVLAENRQGEIIARSRGIKGLGEPIFW